MQESTNPTRNRRNRLDGPTVQRTFYIPVALDAAMTEVMASPEFRNNRSAVMEQALVEFFNRRNDVRAA